MEILLMEMDAPNNARLRKDGLVSTKINTDKFALSALKYAVMV